MPREDIVRVLRIIEYEGPRSWVEATVARSIHGEKIVKDEPRQVIRAATIGLYPEIIHPQGVELHEPGVER